MAAILAVLDGMTDEGFSLNGLPQLQRLARQGASGLLETTPTGAQPETTSCILTLLGLDHRNAGRGWLEALGAGVTFYKKDLLCKASWVAFDEEKRITGLCDALEDFRCPGYTHLHGWQGLLVLPGEAELIDEICTVPPHQSIGAPLRKVMPKGSVLLEAICRKSRSEGRVLVPWGIAVPGKLPQMAGAVVTATNGVRGIGKACGMECPEVKGATGDVDTDIRAKLEVALQAAERHPFTLLHLNGADEAAHRQDAKAKADFLRRVDGMLPILCESGHRVLVCADHGASPQDGRHIAGPQPFVLVNGGWTGELGTLPGDAAQRLLKGKAKWQDRS